MASTSGTIRPASNGILVNWSLASQSVSGDYSIINVAVGWSFQSSPTDRQLDNGLLQVQGGTVWQVNGRVKNYTGSTGAHDYWAWSGQVTVWHDVAGNATLSIYAHMTGYSGYFSEGAASWALPQIPRFPSAPGAPSVSGQADSDPTTASFTWSNPSDVGAGLVHRQILIDTDPGFHGFSGPYIVNSEQAWDNSYNATGLPKGTTMYAIVRATSSAGYGPWSPTTAFTTGITTPSAPGTPTASGITGSTMTVSWAPPADDGGSAITSYEVRRADNSSYTTNLVTTTLPGDSTSFQVTGLSHTKTYFFDVRARNAAGFSGHSATASFTTLATVPGAPAAPTISAQTPTTMTVSWSAPSDNGGSAITGYTVQWSPHPNFDTVSSANVTGSPYTITNLTVSTAYYVRVRAKNAIGSGAFSAATPTRTTSGARLPNAGHTGWVEADVWVPVQGAQGYEWRHGKIVTIAG